MINSVPFLCLICPGCSFLFNCSSVSLIGGKTHCQLVHDHLIIVWDLRRHDTAAVPLMAHTSPFLIKNDSIATPSSRIEKSTRYLMTASPERIQSEATRSSRSWRSCSSTLILNYKSNNLIITDTEMAY